MYVLDFPNINPIAQALARASVGLVEANNFEMLSLWKAYGPNSDKKESTLVASWIEITTGGMFNVGMLEDMPVNVEYRFIHINGQLVMFYWPCSVVTDNRLVEAWRKQYMSHAKHTDAINFHIVLHHINDMNQRKMA